MKLDVLPLIVTFPIALGLVIGIVKFYNYVKLVNKHTEELKKLREERG